MKPRLLLLALATVFCYGLNGQDYYQINFAGINADPETVLVKNLTQNTELEMDGNQTLHLVIKGVSVDELLGISENRLDIFPNPSEHSCQISFTNTINGRVVIGLYSLSGKQLHQFNQELSAGKHTFLLSGVTAGSYLVKVQTSTGLLSGKFVATGYGKGSISLQHISQDPIKTAIGESAQPISTTSLWARGGKNVVEMDFWPGDEILFIGKANGFDNIGINDIPDGDTTYTFEFTNNWADGFIHCSILPTSVVEVTNPTTGKTWMDRNLGASQVATSLTDELSYGDLYQWGRFADGHQCRNSETTTTLSTSNQPGHGSFILAPDVPNDWRSPQNPNLWQWIDGVNNPCPNGYRVPTQAELELDKGSWISIDANGAFESTLKLSAGGFRNRSNGTLANLGTSGVYWTSNVNGSNSQGLIIGGSNSVFDNASRAFGRSVRCIKDQTELPSVNTSTVSQIAATTALAGGEVTDDGGAPVTARGVVWSQTPSPTLLNNEGFTDDGEGMGIFVSSLIELEPLETYYVRAYATNNLGTVYGNELSFTTLDSSLEWPEDYVHCGTPTPVFDVTNPTTGKSWMDRNLGALRVAESLTDDESYGDLYQWGRFADGHQCRNSETTTTLSTTNQPEHGSFIIAPDSPSDWRSPQNDNLWQGIDGVNNPCPLGYRLPTQAELTEERESWTFQDIFPSPLKMPTGGNRIFQLGLITNVGIVGPYWSSTTSGSNSIYLLIDMDGLILSSPRAQGHAIRCIKNDPEIPTVTTSEINSITASSAYTGGDVTSDGGAAVINRGVVWSQTQNPTIANNEGITSDGNGVGPFVSMVANLNPETTYYVRAYATNSIGTAYGAELSFQTLDSSTSWPNGYVHCDGVETEMVEVTNPTTGKTWMDRNLGASRVATASNDLESYGDLYQWGRFADGHHCRDSETITTLSNIDQPGHGFFIIAPDNQKDWRIPQNENLWQGIDGVNNPCPVGYRLPTEAELGAERLSWNSSDAYGAFYSPLKISMAGNRNYENGIINYTGSSGNYWASTTFNMDISRCLVIGINGSFMGFGPRALGFSVRCIKDE